MVGLFIGKKNLAICEMEPDAKNFQCANPLAPLAQRGERAGERGFKKTLLLRRVIEQKNQMLLSPALSSRFAVKRGSRSSGSQI